MDYIEVSGKNVDEALTNALIKLETTSDKVPGTTSIPNRCSGRFFRRW